jgi:hypothetical protein
VLVANRKEAPRGVSAGPGGGGGVGASGHISDYREGDWKNTLTLAEKNRIVTVLGPWLQHHGYEVV